LSECDNPLGDRWLAGTLVLGDDEVNGVRTNMAVSSTRKFLEAFDQLFTPSLTLRKLRPRFFNYNVWQWVPGGAPLSYASGIYRHPVT
jgi:hypothetical protein